jgi:hypothetical protein
VIVVDGERDYRVTTKGADWLGELGIKMESLQKGKRSFARQCLDWTERRPHVAGALGAALMQHFLTEGWLARLRESRALRVTQKGRRAFIAIGVPEKMTENFVQR